MVLNKYWLLIGQFAQIIQIFGAGNVVSKDHFAILHVSLLYPTTLRPPHPPHSEGPKRGSFQIFISTLQQQTDKKEKYMIHKMTERKLVSKNAKLSEPEVKIL